MPQRPSDRPASQPADTSNSSLEQRVREGSDSFAFEALLQGVSAADDSARSEETDAKAAIPAAAHPSSSLPVAPDALTNYRTPKADVPAPPIFSLRWEWLGTGVVLSVLIAFLLFYPQAARRQDLPQNDTTASALTEPATNPTPSVETPLSPPDQTPVSAAPDDSPSSGQPGVFQVRRGSGVTGPLSYWFVTASGHASLRQSLPDPDADGLMTLAIPARFNQANAQVHIVRTETGQVAQYPLAEWVMQNPPAKMTAADSSDLLENGDFNAKLQAWQLDTSHSPAAVTFRSVEPFLASEGVDGRIARIEIGHSTNAEATASLVYPQLMLQESRTYRLRFWARADREREIGISTILNTLSGGTSGLDIRVALSIRWQQFELPFSVAIPVTQRQKQLVVFHFVPPTPAQAVFLAGTFNGWNLKANPMARLADGKTWQTALSLEPGVYQYKFVADGNWFTDPHAQEQNDGSGNMNSLRTITSAPNRHRLSFQLGQDPGVVHLAGISLKPGEERENQSSSENIQRILTLKSEDFIQSGNLAVP